MISALFANEDTERYRGMGALILITVDAELVVGVLCQQLCQEGGDCCGLLELELLYTAWGEAIGRRLH